MYGYNPYSPNIQGYPQRMQTFPQQAPMPINNGNSNVMIMGRLVTGIDEARAAQVALDGTPSYFPSMGEGKIYVKYIGMDGLPVFQTFVVEAQKQNAAPGITLESLAQRVQYIENAIQNLNGGVNNAQPNANDANAPI